MPTATPKSPNKLNKSQLDFLSKTLHRHRSRLKEEARAHIGSYSLDSELSSLLLGKPGSRLIWAQFNYHCGESIEAPPPPEEILKAAEELMAIIHEDPTIQAYRQQIRDWYTSVEARYSACRQEIDDRIDSIERGLIFQDSAAEIEKILAELSAWKPYLGS